MSEVAREEAIYLDSSQVDRGVDSLTGATAAAMLVGKIVATLSEDEKQFHSGLEGMLEMMQVCGLAILRARVPAN
jgi:hypothetical protein